MVKAYGNEMPLNQVGTVSVPEPRMITVQVWDRGLVSGGREGDPRRRARPQPDQPTASSCACRFPQLSEERRAGADEGRPQIRRAGARRRAQRAPRRHGALKKLEKDHKISQDEHRQRSDEVQKTDRPAHQADRRRAGAEGKGDHAGLAWQALLVIRPARVRRVHVAIIMDGNGRWAKARGLPRTVGHQRGAEAVRRTVDRRGRARHLLSDALRLLLGELEAAGRARSTT